MSDTVAQDEVPEGVIEILHTPLETKWNWYAHVDGTDYFKSMLLLGSFNSLFSFFCYKNNIPAPHAIMDGMHGCWIKVDEEDKAQMVSAYSIFKDGITPEWEHERNIDGGSLMCRQLFSSSKLEYAWDHICMWVLQESPSIVNGIRIVQKYDRRSGIFHKLEVWLNSTEPTVVAAVVSELCAIDEDLAPHFMPHKFEKTERTYATKSNAFRRRQPRPI